MPLLQADFNEIPYGVRYTIREKCGVESQKSKACRDKMLERFKKCAPRTWDGDGEVRLGDGTEFFGAVGSFFKKDV